MNLKNWWYQVEDAIPHRICDDIVAFGNQQADEIALVGGLEKTPEKKKDLSKLWKTRNSSVIWMQEPWIWLAIEPYVKEANEKAGWNFDLVDAENFQFTKYSKSQHYSWHQDAFPTPDKNGLVRKISLTLALADGDSYEGGDFEFDLRNNLKTNKSNIKKCPVARKKGTLILFPSFVWHRVTPVTSGTRYSLVIWSRGLPFR